MSNRSSGVQVPRDICAPFGRYLYSTKCSWIIKCISPTKISEWNEVGYLSVVSAHETQRNCSRLDELPVDCGVSLSRISSLLIHLSGEGHRTRYEKKNDDWTRSPTRCILRFEKRWPDHYTTAARNFGAQRTREEGAHLHGLNSKSLSGITLGLALLQIICDNTSLWLKESRFQK